MNNLLFNTKPTPPPANTTNDAGGKAYAMSDEHALAQFAATGTFGDTCYKSAEEQLDRLLELCKRLPAQYIAQVAVWSRKNGKMKDMPAVLCAILHARSQQYEKGGTPAYWLKQAWPHCIDNGKQLRNFVQIVRSGRTGRKSLGTVGKKLVAQWFNARSPEQIFWQSVGSGMSLADVLNLAHVFPKDMERQTLHAYLKGLEFDGRFLPQNVRDYELVKAGKWVANDLPNVPMEMLIGQPLNDKGWQALARRMTWHQLRQNLNTLVRHNVHKDPETSIIVARKLASPPADVLPYTLMAAYYATQGSIPQEWLVALQQALDASVAAVPAIDGKVYVCPDWSGSMGSPITGYRAHAQSQVTCRQVAGLYSAVMVKRNPQTGVIPFDTEVRPVTYNPMDAVLTNAVKFGNASGGGTNCAIPLYRLNQAGARGKLIVMVSDNESWRQLAPTWGGRFHYGQGQSTDMASQWDLFKRRNPDAKLVCIDLTPNNTVQVQNRKDVLNVGGFSDSVWETIKRFVDGDTSADVWVRQIKEVTF